jgi:iron-sulfur cluster assembly protein
MALDEPRETDQIFDEQGVKFVVDKGLLEEMQPLSVDFIETPRGAGFVVKSEALQAGGCGTSCKC